MATKPVLVIDGNVVGDITEQVVEDKVEVVADGVKTWRQMLNSLYALIDFTKITGDSYLLIANPNGVDKTLLTCSVLGDEKQFNGVTSVNSSHFYIGCARFDSSSSAYFSKDVNNNGTITSTDLSSTVCDNGRKFTLYYGSDSIKADFETHANKCMMPDGQTTVEKAITYYKDFPITSTQYGVADVSMSNIPGELVSACAVDGSPVIGPLKLTNTYRFYTANITFPNIQIVGSATTTIRVGYRKS